MPPKPKLIEIENELLSFKEIQDKYGVSRSLINKRTSTLNITQEEAVLMGKPTKSKLKTGDKVGHLTVVKYVELNNQPKKRNTNARYLFKCDCGNIVEKYGITAMKSPNAVCNQRGCLFGGKVFDDGKSSPIYQTWAGMKQRCYNPKNPSYNYYGGIGVRVCDKWLNDFRQFEKDMGERPKGYTLDRINPYGNYEPTNCKWSDKETQAKNVKKNFDLITHINYLQELLEFNDITFNKI